MDSPDNRIREWTGGQLNELISVLSGAALPARIEVYGLGAVAPSGEVHLLAGGLNDAMAGDLRGQDAVAVLQKLTDARFVVETRLPSPEDGSLAKAGPADGNLAERPLVELMRYCEDYVLTCTLEVWRGEEQARLSYRRGELVGTTVGGSDAPERLPEVMAWKEGFYQLSLPPPATPPVPAPSKRSPASAAVVGVNAPSAPATRPNASERPRHGTDPFISVDAIKRKTPPRPVPVLAPESAAPSRLPPGPPMPGLRERVVTPSSQPSLAARSAPAVASTPAARSPAPTAQPPRTIPVGLPAALAKAPQGPSQTNKILVPRQVGQGMVTPPPVAPESQVAPVLRAPENQVTPPPRPAVPAPPQVQRIEQEEMPRVPVTPPPVRTPAPVSLPAAVMPTAAAAAGSTRPVRVAKPRPAGPPAIRGASAVAADQPPSVLNTTSGEIRHQETPARGVELVAATVELAQEMQDPAAFVNTPVPVPAPAAPPAMTETPRVQPIPTPRSPAHEHRPSDRLSAYTSVRDNDLAGDTDKHTMPLRPRGKRGVGRWPLWVHITLGIALGVGAVVAYSVMHGLPLSLP